MKRLEISREIEKSKALTHQIEKKETTKEQLPAKKMSQNISQNKKNIKK